MTSTTNKRRSKKAKTKKLSTRLSKPLKANYLRWLHWDYYGEKTVYEKDGEIKEGPLAVNRVKCLNFWNQKSELTGKQKQETIKDLFSLYRKDEIAYGELLWFCNPISQKKITAHNRNEITLYYCNDPFAKVVNLLVDWDDKERVFGDTEAAARWLDRKFFHDQSYIQPSTSGTGTHQYVYIHAEGVGVIEQKKLYSRLIRVLQNEVRDAGFKCWSKLDQLKGIGPEVSWQQSTSELHTKNPWWVRIDTAGIFAKLPRLRLEDENRWINRKILKWSYLVGLVESLEAKGTTKTDELKMIGSMGAETVPFVSFDELDQDNPPDAIKAEVISNRLHEMLNSPSKQTATLATVFVFENEHLRRPTEDDLDALNRIYNRSATATHQPLTPDRIRRFTKAIGYSEGRQVTHSRSLCPMEAIQKASTAFHASDVIPVNQKLHKAKQRPLNPCDLGRIWSYFEHNCATNDGEVPWTSIKGLADKDRLFKERLSKRAIMYTLRLFEKLKYVEIIRGPDHWNKKCTKYAILKRPLE
jgi:hypothetical protein